MVAMTRRGCLGPPTSRGTPCPLLRVVIRFVVIGYLAHLGTGAMSGEGALGPDRPGALGSSFAHKALVVRVSVWLPGCT